LLTNSLFAQNDSINRTKAQPPFIAIEYVNQVISNLNLPTDKIESLPNENLSLQLSFFVSKDGEINNVRIKDDIYTLSSFFETSMKGLPNWTSAKINGENKSSYQQLAIQLNLKENETNLTTNPEELKQSFYRYFAGKFWLESKDKIKLKKIGYQKDGIIDLKFNVAFILNEKGAIESLKLHESNLKFLEEKIFKIIKEYSWEVQKINGNSISKPFNLTLSIRDNS